MPATKMGSVLRFSFVVQIGWIVALLSRLCKNYLPGQQFKIRGAIIKEETVCMPFSVNAEVLRTVFILIGQLRNTRHVEYTLWISCQHGAVDKVSNGFELW